MRIIKIVENQDGFLLTYCLPYKDGVRVIVRSECQPHDRQHRIDELTKAINDLLDENLMPLVVKQAGLFARVLNWFGNLKGNK